MAQSKPKSNAKSRSAEAPPEAPRRRGKTRPGGSSLRQRLILWCVIAVIVPAFACTVAMNYVASHGMAQAHGNATRQLAKIAAGALDGRLDEGFGADARAVVDRLREDPRVALIEIADAAGQVLHRPISDPDAYAGLSRADLTGPAGSVSRDGVLATSGQYALVRVPVFTSAANQEDASADGAETSTPALSGYLTLGVHDHDAAESLMSINLMQFVVAGGVCLLIVPITAWRVAKWTEPLSALRRALAQLGRGQVPAPIRSSRQDDLGRLCGAFDAMVGSLVQAQAEIADSNKKLENQVEQRTAELRQLNDKLEAEGQDKNEFLRAISHDLNAPLRNVGGMAQMLLMKYKAELPDDAVSKLERIAANVKHQGELISDLLELSRLRTKEQRPEPVDCDALVRRIIENLEYDLGQAKITLALRGRMPTVYIEKNRMRQVLQNLLDNAIKYMMDSEDRKITVSVKRTKDFEVDVFHGLDVWQFSVADTGRGIAAEDVGNVFQVFSRATHSGTHVIAGRGVGLASVKTIVETYGGRIWVDSTLGLGSTFTFTLPVERVAVPTDAVDGSQPDVADKNEQTAAQAA